MPMQYRIEVIHKKDCADPGGLKALGAIRDLGIESVDDVRAVGVFLVDGSLNAEQARTLTEQLFVDPVVQQYPRLRPGRGAVAVGRGRGHALHRGQAPPGRHGPRAGQRHEGRGGPGAQRWR